SSLNCEGQHSVAVPRRSRHSSSRATTHFEDEIMKIFFLALMLAASLHAVSISVVVAQQKSPPPPGPTRPLNLPQLTEKKLSNGLTVVLAPLPNVPKLTAVLTFRGADTAADREKHPGIAQIASTVANEGTDTRTSKQIKEELRSIGGSLSLGSDSDSTS